MEWPLFPDFAMTSPFATLRPGCISFGAASRCRKIAFRPVAGSRSSRQFPLAEKCQLRRVISPAKGAFTGVPTGVL